MEDDQYSTPKTLCAYNRLVTRGGIKTVFIYTYSALLALADRAQKDGVRYIFQNKRATTSNDIIRNIR